MDNCGNLRWPYQAVVMKRFEITNNKIGVMTGDCSIFSIINCPDLLKGL
jgi:hypothetical protein